jgi:hypothetical protein
VVKEEPAAREEHRRERCNEELRHAQPFRKQSARRSVKMSVALDGRILGDTAAKTFLLASVDPGPHALVSKAENDARLEFVAEPGKNVYVWQEVKMGLLMARSKLQLVDEESARARVNECSLALGEMMPPLPQASAPAPTPTKEPAAIPGS